MTSDVEPFFLVPIGFSYIFFGEMSIQVLYPFLHWITWIFSIELYGLQISIFSLFSHIYLQATDEVG